MTAQTLGAAEACTQARKAQEAKGAEPAPATARLQCVAKSVRHAPACPVVQPHGAHLYVPTFLAALLSAKTGMLVVTQSWSSGVSHVAGKFYVVRQEEK